MELKHLCHEHPLKLTEDKNDDGMKNFCHGCYQWITCSAYYSCTNCAFFLHKLCAKLPTEIKHPMYLKSPLTLHPHTPNYTWQCHVCHKYLNRFQYCCSPFTRDVNFHPQTPNYAWSCHVCHNFLLGFQYCCSPFTHDTNFCVHMRCAARAISVEHKFHEHPLTPFLRLALFNCHACGTEHKHKGFSYICSTCDFWIHEDCAFLPTTFKLSTHVHSLTLCYTPMYDATDHLCRICNEELRINRWIYQCKGCRYYVHVDCSTKPKSRESESVMKVEDFDVNNLIHLPMPDDSVNLIDQFVEQFSLRHANNKGEAELNRLNHDHPLILFDTHSDDNLCPGSKSSIPPNQQKNAKICDACVLPISAPFYNCGQCNLFLHKRCVDLPNEIQHPCLPHPLSLRMSNTTRVFDCNGCEQICNGFSFQCTLNTCEEEFLDIKCASLPSSIVHEVHEHPLHLRPDCAEEGCVACSRREWTFSYGCGICNFTLHWYCALLPRTIKHRYDKHPFTLIYAPIKDGPDEYICEFCEEDIDPKWWFYHCIDCDQSACARCIYKEENEYPKIKFGTTGNFGIHPHPLTVVQVANEGLLCAMCRTRFYGDMTGHICVQCNIRFHSWCVGREI